MDTTNHDQNKTEATVYEEICPRHGARVRQHYGCPKCVIEEVRRHERRADALFERELPMATDSIFETIVPPAEIG